MRTKKIVIISLAVAAVVVYYFLGTGYLKIRDEGKEMEGQIANYTQWLALVPLPPQDLEERLAAAEARLDAARESIPEAFNTTRLINDILEIADETGVKAVPLVTRAWAEEAVGQNQYRVFRLHVTATGDYQQVTDFLDRLETGPPETLVIEAMSVQRLSAPAIMDEVLEEIIVSAEMDIAVYTRYLPGGPEEESQA